MYRFPFLFALVFGSFLTAFSHFALASTIEIHEFSEEHQRQLYLHLTQVLRCPRCQNQNIADSNSQIAIDLRNQVARLVKQGQSEEEIKTYMVNRYGEFVLYEPPVNKGTYLLWFGPFVIFALGALVFTFSILKRRKNMREHSEEVDQSVEDEKSEDQGALN